jgi:hypothetical protein
LLDFLGLEKPGSFLILSKALHELKLWIYERIIKNGLKKYARIAQEKQKICLQIR